MKVLKIDKINSTKKAVIAIRINTLNKSHILVILPK
jgi:hypothetical protein